MLNTPFPPWPAVTDDEVDAAVRVLRSNRVNYWTGEEGRAFEKEFAAWCGSEHAVAVANGTVALDLCWVALHIQPGDEVIVTSRTFMASASSILVAGGTPVFADVDRDSQNISVDTVTPLITDRTRAILCVHLAGWPCDMPAFQALADSAGLALVEDCAQAHGAAIGGQPVGSWGTLAAWSFCQDKIMTTAGEGGMVTTNDKTLWRRIWSYKDHGKSWEAVYETHHEPGFRWLHEDLGTNWRLTEVQSAIGRRQLQAMPQWQAARERNARVITESASRLPGLRVPVPEPRFTHAQYKCYVFVEPAALKASWDRDRIMNEIVASGVPCYSGSCSEVYREKVFSSRSLAPLQRLPVAQELGDTSLMFLVHPTLGETEMARTVDALEATLAAATR